MLISHKGESSSLAPKAWKSLEEVFAQEWTQAKVEEEVINQVTNCCQICSGRLTFTSSVMWSTCHLQSFTDHVWL